MTSTTPPRVSRRTQIGLGALAVALIALVGITFLPTGYVVQRPGPVYDTLGEAENADGESVPLIEVSGAETFETGGALDLTTVQVVGNREHNVSWVELAMAWVSPAKAVVPVDVIFPDGVTTEERNERNAALMTDSQHEATAAALTELGFDVQTRIMVHDLLDDSPAHDALRSGDIIVSANGTELRDVTELRGIIQAGAGAPVDLVIDRDGETREVTVTPEQIDSDQGAVWVIGVTLIPDYTFPVDVTLQLDNVGGPSAGLMFALGIIDVLTPGELNGGETVAGTGTIDASGNVGPIGGIRQKLFGARDAGASFFLAPAANCNEVVGHIPRGLQVVRTETLQEALDALTVIADDGDVSALPACTVSTTASN